MGRFVEGQDRRQDYLLPASLDDYVSEDNPVRAVEAFIDALDLKALEFVGMTPAETGRPAYHPATMLKIYLYGYLNRVQSSRRLEREAQRNVEMMWLTGRLAPDFKTIANFRQANGSAIRAVCSQFIVLCRQLNLFVRAVVAIDGSKMKAVNNRDKNYTAAKVRSRMQQVQDNIDRYLEELERADREESDIAEPKTARLNEKIARLRDQMRALETREEEVRLAPDQQVSLTDPDARAMTSAGRGTSIVGYNLQAAVDAEHHLIVAHELLNIGSDRGQLSTMAAKAKHAMGAEALDAIADKGYFKGEEIRTCEGIGVTAFVPRPLTSGAKARQTRFYTAFHQGVPLCVLTDGREWSFYVPGGQGSYEDRRVYRLQLDDRDAQECQRILTRYLARERVRDGSAFEDAQRDYRDAAGRREAAAALPRAWTELMTAPDDLLLDIVGDKAEALCGFKPGTGDVLAYLRQLRAEHGASGTGRKRQGPPVHPGGLVEQASLPTAMTAGPSSVADRTVTFSLFGQKHSYSRASLALVEILRAITARDLALIEQLAEAVRGRSRNLIARRAREINPARPDLARAAEFAPGWLIGLNISNREKMAIIRTACDLYGLSMPVDLDIRLPNAL